MIADLKKLWQEAFHEPEDFTELFFSEGFSRNRCHCIWEDGVPVSALYWFDCFLKGRKLAYIYGVATLKSHQGKGLASQLMEQTHEILKNQDYAGAFLVPAGESLFDFYRKFGYETATTVTEFICEAGAYPAKIQQITPEEYVRYLPVFMPSGNPMHSIEAFTFLNAYCKFYAGADFLLTCEETLDGLRVQEFLGNIQAAPGILNAMGLAKGSFRTPGSERDFAMWLPFREDCPKPGWFALALN